MQSSTNLKWSYTPDTDQLWCHTEVNGATFVAAAFVHSPDELKKEHDRITSYLEECKSKAISISNSNIQVNGEITLL